MDKLVKDVFDDVCGHVKLDEAFCKRTERYMNEFISRNHDHASFFGGNLTGVYVVKFTTNDRIAFFEEVLGVDEDELRPRLNALIDPSHFMVAGDVLNLTIVWLSHALLKSSLNPTRKEQVMSYLYNIMQFRFITSRLQRHWPYPCSKEVAEATVSAMTNKYAIKMKGSWIKVIQDRSLDVVDMKHSVHRETIKKMDYDIRNKGYSVGYLITDTQTRNKAMLKNIYGLQKEVQESGFKINASSSTFLDKDGVEVMKDKDNALETYRNYLLSIAGDKISFIKMDLISIIEGMNKTMPKDGFRVALNGLVDAYNKNTQAREKFDFVFNAVLTHMIVLVTNNRHIMKHENDIASLLAKLKNIYGATRTDISDDFVKAKDILETHIIQSTKIKRDIMVSVIRTGLMLYIVLRAITRKHYGG